MPGVLTRDKTSMSDGLMRTEIKIVLVLLHFCLFWVHGRGAHECYHTCRGYTQTVRIVSFTMWVPGIEFLPYPNHLANSLVLKKDLNKRKETRPVCSRSLRSQHLASGDRVSGSSRSSLATY